MKWFFKNPTVPVIKRLSKRSLQADKRRNLLVITAITFAVCLMSAVALFYSALSIREFGDMRTRYQSVVMERSRQEAERIRRDARIEKSGLRLDVSSYRDFDRVIYIRYEDQEHIDLIERVAVNGALPEKENEIALESGYLKEYGLPETVGQTIRLDLGKGEMDYVLSGILPSANGLKEFHILVSEKLARELHPEDGGYELKIRMKDSENWDAGTLRSNIFSFFAEYGIPEKEVFFSSTYFGKLDTRASIVAVACFGAFIIMACSVVIYSLFYTSVISKTREYGRLKVLGATPRQIKRVIRRESLSLSMVSIPIGLLAGSLIAFFIMPAYWSWRMNFPRLVIIAAAMELTIVLATRVPMKLAGKVSPIEAIRITAAAEGGKKAVFKNVSRKISLAGLAYRNFSRNRKKTVLTMVSFGFTSILLMCIATYSNSVDAENIVRKSIPFGEYKLSLSLQDPRTMAALQAENPLDAGLLEDIYALSGTSHVEVYQMCTIALPNAEQFVDIFGLTKGQMKALAPYVAEGSMDYEEMERTNGVVVSDTEKLYDYYYNVSENVGDTLCVVGLDGASKEFTITGEMEYWGMDIGFIMTDRMFAQTVPETENKNFYYVIETDGSNPNYREQLYETVTDARINVTVFKDNVEEMKRQLESVDRMLYMVMVFTFLFAILNLINTLMTGLITRQQELGILQSVGLSNRQLAQMLFLECFCYVAGTYVLTLTAGTLSGYLLCMVFRYIGVLGEVTYRFPLLEVLVYFAALFLVQMIFSVAAVRYSRKQSLVERIRVVG